MANAAGQGAAQETGQAGAPNTGVATPSTPSQASPGGTTALAAVPPGTATAPAAAPGGVPVPGGAPVGNGAPPAARDNSALASEISDFTTVTDVSNHSLNPLINDSLPAARAASMRTVEQAREQIQAKDSTSALALLSQAISIDPSNPYAYFYLGRAYLAKRNAAQALTFLRRAEIGFGDNPQWLAETRAFEGCAYELTGDDQKAQEAYHNALDAASDNYLAQVGYARVARYDAQTAPGAPAGPVGAGGPTPETGSSATAPEPPANEPEATGQGQTSGDPAARAGGAATQAGDANVADDPAAPPEEPGTSGNDSNAEPASPDPQENPSTGNEPGQAPASNSERN